MGNPGVSCTFVSKIARAAWRLARIERSFYRALRELQRLQKEMAKQSQIAPEPMPEKDLTPPSDDHPISKSPNPQSSRPPIVYNGNIHESSRLRIAQAHCP